jgi:hypothetical protein
MEEYTTMSMAQMVRRDGELLTQLVERRRQAAEALQETADGASGRDDIVVSIQAWEMAIRLVVQLQNLSRREEHEAALQEQLELISNIRCAANNWAFGRNADHIVSARQGQKMLRWQRELETHFGERGRPTDSQLTAICEGREIYMGVQEDEVDVDEGEAGTGPRSGDDEQAEGEESSDEASSAVDDLLGEEGEEDDEDDDDDDEEEEEEED